MEDGIVSLAERPQLPRQLVRAVAGEFLTGLGAGAAAGIGRTDLMRDVAKRLLRRTPLIEYTALTDSDLETEAAQALTASATALGGTWRPAALTADPTAGPHRPHNSPRTPPRRRR